MVDHKTRIPRRITRDCYRMAAFIIEKAMDTSWIGEDETVQEEDRVLYFEAMTRIMHSLYDKGREHKSNDERN